MKIISTLVLTLAMAAAMPAAETANDLFQQALAKERTEGNLPEAIKLYQRIVDKHVSNRKLAAEALLQMAECQSKLGDAQSRKSLERLVRDFGDQKDTVALARLRLGASANGQPKIATTRKVWTALDRADFFGTVSPDGRYIPYTHWSEKGNLYVHDLVTGADRRLTDTAVEGASSEWAEQCSFSGDSKQVAYTWGKREGVELRVVSLQTPGVPKPRVLVKNPELKWIHPYGWSPDGKVIAAEVQRRDHTAQLVLVSLEDGSLRVLKTVDWRLSEGLFFSPDGKYLAYDIPAAEDASGQRDIFVLAADGSVEAPAVMGPSRDSLVGWSPDGKRLVFSSDRGGSRALWGLRIDDGKPQGGPDLLKQDFGEHETMGLSNSGAVYASIHSPWGMPEDILFGAFDFSGGRFLSGPVSAATSFPGANGLISWSRDGKNMAFVSMRRSHVAIGIRSMQTGQVRELVPTPNFTPSLGYFWSLNWATDGNSLIVTARNDKYGTGVFRIDAQTGQSSPISAAGSARGAVITADAKTLYYRKNEREGAAIIRVDLSSGQERQVIQRKGMIGSVMLSPDGRNIGVTVSDEAGKAPLNILLISTADDKVRELLRVERDDPRAGAAMPNFSPDGRYVVVGAPKAGASTLTFTIVPVDGGSVRELMPGANPPVVSFAMWAPDSRSVFVRRRTEGQPAQLWQIPMDGGEARKLDVKAGQGFLPSPDGRHIALSTPALPRKPTEIWVTENFLPGAGAIK